MIKPDVIIKTNRRSLSITITKNGQIVVRAPKRLSVGEIVNFVSEKEKWITRKKNEIDDRKNQNQKIISLDQFLFLGKKYEVEKIDGVKKVELSGSKFYLPSNTEELSNKVLIKKWYIKSANDVLKTRINYFADIMDIDYNTVSLINSRRKWGSCDSVQNIKLNYKMVMLPHKLIDFIIVHELAHILELNHSKRFYKIISAIMPDYETHRKSLKEYDYLLTLM